MEVNRLGDSEKLDVWSEGFDDGTEQVLREIDKMLIHSLQRGNIIDPLVIIEFNEIKDKYLK